jgi:hypothetical protein
MKILETIGWVISLPLTGTIFGLFVCVALFDLVVGPPKRAVRHYCDDWSTP